LKDCSAPLPSHIIEGIRLFNAGQYFECHEELELAWREEHGEIRTLYQGILQAAVTYLHMRRGNFMGAVKVYKRCIKYLDAWPETCRGVNVGKLRADLTRAMQFWQGLGPTRTDEMDWSLLQPVEFREHQ
jgi:predicted metal-dependent hydrolase